MTELSPVEAAEQVTAFLDALDQHLADYPTAVREAGYIATPTWADVALTAPMLRVLTAHAYATGIPCDGQRCEQGGAAHCHRCPEAETDNLLAERDRLRARLAAVRELGERWAALAPADDWGDSMGDTAAADAGRALLAALDATPAAEPDPLNLPAYAWGESVTWNQGRILVPLNRDDQTVADLVLDEDAAGTLAAMLDDAAGHKSPDCPRCFDRGYVPDWSAGLSAEFGEPGKKPCPDCAPPVQGHLELEPMPCHQPQGTWASNHDCDPCATCGRCRICDAVARRAAERTPHSEESTHVDQ